MYDEAIRTLQTMVDKRPDINSYSRISYARELHGDLDGAIDAMRKAFAAGGAVPENTEYVRVQLANLYLLKGDLPAAEKLLKASLTVVPDYYQALGAQARLRAMQGRSDEAMSLYRRAIDRIPLPETLIGLGELQEAAGNREEAAKQYAVVRAIQELFKQNGVDTDVELAIFEADHGDPAKAVALARTGYAARPSVKGADALAWSLYRAGRVAEAQRYATEATRLGSVDPVVLTHAGLIARAAGDTSSAAALLKRALAPNAAFSPLLAPLARSALGELTAAGTVQP
jgi:tetratricopeptide (TPR) repeat protein